MGKVATDATVSVGGFSIKRFTLKICPSMAAIFGRILRPLNPKQRDVVVRQTDDAICFPLFLFLKGKI